ncbi:MULTISPECIES: septum site-determining protein MinD [Kosmotoga]|uniref:Septum site-determining protein MinD n=1 Tax=Kosmotoga olearia (strain ATCC BAA-1733 / DSM 21960 / TBF 19.5.1) TaxID=521045 RepID=C5CEN2_KOSOT|nr:MULTISPECIES: septum site-determining protein MinD [Kosmotoga]ACR80212.1 septum site-determining protein MinD [Kosmotoga olearia TBF 19.5.1]MDI3523504.1 septum site-determining protein MinD [Kosmotoga sp.]MDK2952954.1 septum site-determining protein MinD [Kosmotoga sp.]OAA20152.1 septum site-determining protein MinD [Kosmotoga sp. DU53]
MAKVYVVTSGKGGVGKTTITANIGCALAAKGDKVCLIDADIGLKNLDITLGLENRVVHTILDVVNGKVKASEALVRHKQMKSLYLLAASQIATKEMLSPEDMKRIVGELYGKFDYIIIDSPAGIERGFRNAVAPAENAIIVTTPELPAITDADRVIGLLENAGMTEDRIKLVINRFKVQMVKRGDMLTKEDIQENLAIDLLGIIPDSEDVIVATNRGIPVVLNGNQGEGIAKVFENIALRMKGELISIEKDLHSQQSLGFLDLLKRIFGRS